MNVRDVDKPGYYGLDRYPKVPGLPMPTDASSNKLKVTYLKWAIDEMKINHNPRQTMGQEMAYHEAKSNQCREQAEDMMEQIEQFEAQL